MTDSDSERHKQVGETIDNIREAGRRKTKNEMEVALGRPVSDDEVSAETTRRRLKLYNEMMLFDSM